MVLPLYCKYIYTLFSHGIEKLEAIAIVAFRKNCDIRSKSGIDLSATNVALIFPL
jgi:hypothetical protein